MKKLIVAVAAAGLFSLAACGSNTANETAAENAGEALENQADNMEAMADNATNATTENMLDNAADNAEAAADNVSENEATAADNAMVANAMGK